LILKIFEMVFLFNEMTLEENIFTLDLFTESIVSETRSDHILLALRDHVTDMVLDLCEGNDNILKSRIKEVHSSPE